MNTVSGPAPGFHRHPGHRISVREAGERWQAKVGELFLAASDDAKILEESGYGAVVYFPPHDVHDSALIASKSETACPFKGGARYFSLASAPDGRDVAWTYPTTYDEVAAIARHVAFYADRVSITKGNHHG